MLTEFFQEKAESLNLYSFKKYENSGCLIIIQGILGTSNKNVKLTFYDIIISIQLEYYHLIIQNIDIEFLFSNKNSITP